MASRAMKKEMLDYLVAKMKGCNPSVEPAAKEMIPGIRSSYIKVGKNGLVLLVDQAYPNDGLEEMRDMAKNQGRTNMAYVFLKDGELFFRSSVAGMNGKPGLHTMRGKQEKGLSLKRYSKEELQKMITFRPEEVFVFGEKRKALQYYQPESPNLEEGLENFEFKNVHFDYGHISGDSPEEKDSVRLHIWTLRNHNTSPLVLDDGYLKRKEIYEEQQRKAQAAKQ